MHELLLFAPVPPSSSPSPSTSTPHPLLTILSSLAATPPIPHTETHQIYKPLRSPSTLSSNPIGGSQGITQSLQPPQSGDLFYLHLLSTTTSSSTPTLLFTDLPSPNARLPCTFRTVHRIPFLPTTPVAANAKANANITTTTSHHQQQPPSVPSAFLSALGYAHTATYDLVGHRLTHGNVDLFLSQCEIPEGGEHSEQSKQSPPSGTNECSSPHGRPLDPSLTLLLRASLLLQDGSNPEVLAAGVAELTGLKEMLRGVVELEKGERLGLDTRVR
ncbi:Mediator of RNA polymerase II transcription subunit 18 [Loxospora ochrophaea]|nr:Mediator of RNA polymerase II transcription subunit 18 [Loxospora ochrophaea]